VKTADIQLWSTLAVTIATIAVAVLTALYVRFTRQMVNEMRRSRESYVVVDLEVRENALRLVVSNLGLSLAVNIRLEALAPLEGIGTGQPSRELASLSPFTDGIAHLSPGRSLKWQIGYLRPEQGWLSSSLQVRVHWSNESGKTFSRVSRVPLRQLKGVLHESFESPEVGVSRAIRDSAQRSAPTIRSVIMPEAKKRCVACAEWIPKSAKVCSHCQRSQESDSSREHST
jgi:hypothetical protein